MKDVKINYQIDWIKKHKAHLYHNYCKSKGNYILKKVFEIYDKKHERLVDLNIEFIKLIKELLCIETELIIDEEIFGTKHEYYIQVSKKYDCEIYLSGNGAKKYMTDENINEIEKNGITHSYIEENPFNDHKYSALHYILINGSEAVSELFKKQEIKIMQ